MMRTMCLTPLRGVIRVGPSASRELCPPLWGAGDDDDTIMLPPSPDAKAEARREPRTDCLQRLRQGHFTVACVSAHALVSFDQLPWNA
jgi:hypothetical protein